MTDMFLADSPDAVPVLLLNREDLKRWLESAGPGDRNWVAANGFDAEPGGVLTLPDADGMAARVLAGTDGPGDMWSCGGLPHRLKSGAFRIENELGPDEATRAAIAWGLGCYAFDAYSDSKGRNCASLVWPANADRNAVLAAVEAQSQVRDLINTPANDMGPERLETVVRELGKRHGAQVSSIVGADLLAQNYPTIHAVGRAAAIAPRLIDLVWGDEGRPKLTLVGKGVCFDSGGLDLKPPVGMRLMKKDMGGAANMIGLAHMVMSAALPVRLRLMVPAVENSVSGNAMRPMDVIRTRKGLTVEIGNTDAEGRLILCDALAEASSESPDLILDCATLTGAARTALGADLPALFCNDDAVAAALLEACEAEQDPVWRMPLFQPYRKLLSSDVADMNNVSDGPLAGAITAALFLERFIEPGVPWAHVDMMAWNRENRPGRPRGGEAQFIRGAMAMLRRRYGE